MNAKNMLYFVAGCITGAAVAGMYLKDKFAAIAQEEIDSIKDEYAVRTEEETSEKEDDEEESNLHSSMIQDYKRTVEDAGYVNYNDISKKETKTKKTKKECSHIEYIDPDESGEELEYDRIELTLYSDGTLADDCDEIVDDVNLTVGADFMSHIGEFEAGVVHVKNNKLHAYYEVITDDRSYSDVVGI